MDMVSFVGLTVQSMTGSLKITISMEMDGTGGLMEDHIRAHGI
jgi:hypothetical protein